ncbi:winged helix-turn-helix transcriptional regulator [Larkinella insperata]|uniref:Winged helix-turn-helix transcriptional regulator n=1 Tax=Larkinella insperata TaxID=332158 RepID=A0ABW3QKI9_9BACT
MMPKDRIAQPADAEYTLIRRALEIISGKWRLYLILLLDEHTLRYSELRQRLPAVSEKVLAGELKALVTLGVIRRDVFAEVPLRVEYTLTSKGRSALPILRQMKQIGQIFNEHFDAT